MSVEQKRVTVGVRVRPKLDGAVNALQSSERYEAMACAQQSETVLRLWDGRRTTDSRTYYFSYDSIFDEHATQEEVYDELAQSAVDGVLRGTNATILTYGQTGSGKTYTVLGAVPRRPLPEEVVTPDTGILLRALQDVLHFASHVRPDRHVVLGLSAVEIYLDEVRDLLCDGPSPVAVPLSMARDALRLPGLTVRPVRTLEDGWKAFLRATARRAQRATSANDTSSRSHALFTMELFQQPRTAQSAAPMSLDASLALRDAAQWTAAGERPTRPLQCDLFDGASNPLLGPSAAPVLYSKLVLADLAGSEKARTADVRGEGFDELRKINASLTALGNVVHSLHEGSRHIPYRDAKLTMVLRDAFAAMGARIVLIVNISPTVLTVDETLSSLYFADKVKAIKPDPATMGGKAHGQTGTGLADAYLESLRTYDALLADVRIAAVLHRYSAPQSMPIIAGDARNALYDLTLHVRRPDGDIRRMAFRMLCETLRLTAAEQNPRAEWERELHETHRVLCASDLSAWRSRNAEMRHALSALAQETQSIRNAAAMDAAERDRVLESASAELAATRAARREGENRVRQTRDRHNAATTQLRSLESQLESHVGVSSRSVSASSSSPPLCSHGEAEWAMAAACYNTALAAARRRLELCALRRDVRRLEREKAAAARPPPPGSAPDVYGWLRHAVWAMAGNAVTMAHRHSKRRTATEPEVVAGLGVRKGYAAPTRPYWHRHVKALTSTPAPTVPSTPTEAGSLTGTAPSTSGLGSARRGGTRYDDPSLLEDIASFVRMGGEMEKFGRGGEPRRRLFYVEQRHEVARLSWGLVGDLGREGHIPVDSITHILLGPSAPPATRPGKARACEFCWGLIHTREGASKTLRMACDSVSDLEAWVIGLSQLTGLMPRFEEPMEPNNNNNNNSTEEEEEEEEKAWASLRHAEAALCREWHLPPAVFAEARDQLRKRQKLNRFAGLHLLPGELRHLVKLDIFRATAMWLYFKAEGLIASPRKRINYFVELKSSSQSIPDSTSMTSIGVIEKSEDSASKVNCVV